MKHLTLLPAFVPTLLNAETFTIDTSVSEVTVYPEGAEIIRTGTFDIPAGNHRLVLLGVPVGEDERQVWTMQFQAEGLAQSSLIMRAVDVPWHDYVSDEINQAEDRISDIEDRVTTVKDQAATARLTAEAARQKIAFLSNLGRNEGLAGSDTDVLRSIARMVGDESLEAVTAAQTAEIQAREVEAQLEDLEIELEAAEANLSALLPETEDRLFVAVDVTAQTNIQGSLSLSYLNLSEATWFPGYEFDLTTGETPEVQITRRVLVNQYTGENWENVKLKVSTLQPAGQNSASRMNSRRMFIREKVVQKPVSDGYGSLEEPIVEAPVVVEETANAFMIDPSSIQGTGVTYALPNPISIASGQSVAEFELDSMTQSADVFALATPRYDDTAYRTARFTNPYDQNLFPSEVARYLVNGALVAADFSPKIGPGEEIELGFGPLYGLVVDRDVLSRSSGDVGLISRSNEDVQRAEIQLENLTAETWPLRVIDRVPYSEQSDLEIAWTATPRPSDENVDNRRGVLAWELELAPGQTETIQLNTTLSWPEGMVLR